MVTARIRTNARKINVKVKNGPTRTIVAKPVRAIPARVVVPRKPTLTERLLRPFRALRKG